MGVVTAYICTVNWNVMNSFVALTHRDVGPKLQVIFFLKPSEIQNIETTLHRIGINAAIVWILFEPCCQMLPGSPEKHSVLPDRKG